MIINEIVDSLEKVRSGAIVQSKNLLQNLGYFDKITQITLQIISDCASESQAKNIEEYGFEQLHNFLTAEQIYKINDNLSESIKPILGKMVYDFVKIKLGYEKDFFIDNKPVVRFFTPHDYYSRNPVLAGKQGFLKIQGPHHDTWFGHATEGLNIWMAIGRVIHGNGLSIYPEVWGRYINHNGTHRMPRDQYLGVPVNFELNPGDVLFFHGEHMHSSELNITKETRYVLTSRFSIFEPKIIDGVKAPWLYSKDFDEN